MTSNDLYHLRRLNWQFWLWINTSTKVLRRSAMYGLRHGSRRERSSDQSERGTSPLPSKINAGHLRNGRGPSTRSEQNDGTINLVCQQLFSNRSPKPTQRNTTRMKPLSRPDTVYLQIAKRQHGEDCLPGSVNVCHLPLAPSGELQGLRDDRK